MLSFEQLELGMAGHEVREMALVIICKEVVLWPSAVRIELQVPHELHSKVQPIGV